LEELERYAGRVFSTRFQDIYFSVEGGLEESRHVFIEGNFLKERWNESDWMVIGELGFGTGLNAFVVERELPRNKKVRFVTCEKYPLEWETIKSILTYAFGEEPSWDNKLYTEKRISYLEGQKSEWAKLSDNNFVLEVFFGDVQDFLNQEIGYADAWFLDGFSPKKNPEMWSETVLEKVKKLSKIGTTFATFSAASLVKKKLIDLGFSVKKVPGFGKKRDMLRGEIEFEI